MIIRIVAFIAIIIFFVMLGLALVMDLRNNHRKIDKTPKGRKKTIDADKKHHF